MTFNAWLRWLFFLLLPLLWLNQTSFAQSEIKPGTLEPTTVQLNWKHQFEFAAFYAAQSQGYYRQAGLDVAIKEGGPGIDTTKEVTSGRADFGVGTSTLVVDRSRGQPVVALAAMMQHSPVALLALRRNGINSIHDLAGRPVAVDPHNRVEIEAYMLASGIPQSRIDLVDQTDWTMASLDEGRVAAKVIYKSNETYLIRGHEHEYLLLTPQSAGIDLFGNILFTSQNVLNARPNLVKAFREATLKGLVYALDHPKEITDLILQRYNTQAKSRAHLLFEAEQIRELTRPDIVEPGYMSPGRWRHVVDVYTSQGKLDKDFDLSGFIYDTTPAKTPDWVIWAILGLLALLCATVAVLIKLRNLNQKLTLEIGERAQAESARHESEMKYRELVDNANAIILRSGLDGTITYFNEFAERFFGYTAEEILGRHVIGTIVPERESNTETDLSKMVGEILAHPENFEHNENENMTRDGRRVWVRWANKVIVDAQKRPIGISSIGQDITESKLAEETIRNLAFFDALTHLPNRRLLLDRLRQALAMSARTLNHGALLFIDLDNFKLLNDSHGHDLGDQLLLEVATRLLSCVREGDSVARLGGDEFVVMLEDVGVSAEDAVSHVETVTEKILELLARPYHLSKLEHHSTASVGIALFQDKSLGIDELLRRADLAMYQAKASGRNTHRFFDPAMQAMVESRTRMEAELRRAIQREELMFHYQPQVNADGKMIGVEALARWQHPERGWVSPIDFIGLAEETGLIIPLGQQLLGQACAQFRVWSSAPDTADLSISINISARQFHHPDFVPMVLDNLAACEVKPNRLMLEITESLLLENIDETVTKMHLLKAHGIRFSIDDFGTGYSSLAYLKRLPLDELKIDRSFVADLASDENDAAICAAFISLAHLLGLRVVAEGVETETQRHFLSTVHHCDAMQGYLFSKPVPADQITGKSAFAVAA
jgi:diguanylate cyclase (GGDEF)-like protein/PAS domain S-box-containing protein